MIKFFNETDMIYGHYIDKIKNKIIHFDFKTENEVNIILEYFNIIKYYKNNRVKEYLDLETNLKSIKVIEYMENQLVVFIRSENKKIFFYYDQVCVEYLKDFGKLLK